MELQVWAPKAKQVRMHAGHRIVRMRGGPRGWWTASAAVRHGEDYAFSIDGGKPLPDPRSRWQPAGVHGFSRAYDDSHFTWNDSGWRPVPIESAVIYEIHIGTFSDAGTFEGAIQHLDSLVELGITHVELMPVAEFSGSRGWGYDGVSLFAPHHVYGGPDGLKRLVDACHSRGLAVLLDVVYNHLGPAGNYLGAFGHYFNSKYSTPWGDAINFEGADSDIVRRFFCENALMWLRDFHCDGLRLDAVHAICDLSAVHFLEQMSSEVARLQAKLGRYFSLIAESDLNDPRMLWPVERGGYNLHAQWNDDFHHALHTVLTGEKAGYYSEFGRFDQLAKSLRHAFVFDGGFSSRRRRRHGRPIADLRGSRFVGSMQNHDQIGNRARGERTSHLLTAGQLKIAAAFVLCSPFIPMLFQGEEWAASTPFLYFTDHEDPDLAEAVRAGRHSEFAPFGWQSHAVPDPQAVSSFTKSRLRWHERKRGRHAELLEWHRALISIRRQWVELADGRLDRVRTDHDQQAGWFILDRSGISIVANFSPRPCRVPLEGASRRVPLLFSSRQIQRRHNDLKMPGHSVVLLGPRKP